MTAEPLPNLETFAEAAERGSFTAAARKLGLTQAAVSQRIQALEQSLGVALFRRRGGRVTLTDAGKRLHPYAQRLAALHRNARQAVTGTSLPLSGELLLAASSVPGEYLLPKALAEFGRKYPHIHVRATIADSQAVLRQVELGQVHLGLVGMRPEHPHLEFRAFARDRLVVLVPSRHAWAKKRQVSFHQLSQQPLVLREPGSGSRWCLEQALAQIGKSPRDLRVAMELGSNESIMDAVRRGLGVAVLSIQAVAKEVRTGRLHALRVSDLSMERDIFAVWDRRRVLPAPAQLFLQFLGS